MPRHEMLLERERGFAAIPTNGGAQIPILARARPGWAAAVYHIDVSASLIGNNFAWGITGNLSLAPPTSLLDVLADPLLIYGSYMSAPNMIDFPFEAPLLLPGRVLFRVRNESGTNRNIHIGLYYTRLEIGVPEWTDLMRSRSLEVS